MDLQEVFIVSLAAVVCIILARLVVYIVVKYQRNQFERLGGQVDRVIESATKILARVEEDAKQYPQTKQELYYGDLHKKLDQVREKHSNILVERKRVAEQAQAIPIHRFLEFGIGVWSEPYHWWQLGKEMSLLEIQAKQLVVDLHDTEELLRDLRGEPLVIASQRCDLLKKVGSTLRKAQDLRSAGVHGETIDSMIRRVSRLGTKLNKLPDRFSHKSPGQIMRATKEDIRLARQILTQIGPSLMEKSKDVRQWCDKHQALGQDLPALDSRLDDQMRQQLGTLSQFVHTDDLIDRMDALNEEIARLRGIYRAPTIEDLINLSNSFHQVNRDLGELCKEVDSRGRKNDSLREAIVTNERTLRRIARRMEQIEHAKKCPLIWQQSKTELDQLRKLGEIVGTSETVRTPVQLDEHLSISKNLEKRAQALEDTVATAGKKRTELLGLLETPKVSIGTSRVSEVGKLQNRISGYAQVNWPESDRVAELLSDARDLAKEQERLVPQRLDQSVHERQLGDFLKAMRGLAGRLETFDARRLRVQHTVKLLQEDEQAAKGRMSNVERALKSLTIIGDPVLPTLSLSIEQSYKKVADLKREGDTLKADLERRDINTVASKVKRVERWSKSCERNLLPFARQLKSECKKYRAELDKRVIGLRKLALFDREKSMERALILLQDKFFPGSSLKAGDEPSQVDQLVKRANALSQEVIKLYWAIDGVKWIGRQVYDLWDQLCAEREDTRGQLDALRSKTARIANTSEPITCDLSNVQTRWNNTITEIEQLKTRLGTTVDYVRSRLHAFLEDFREIAELVRQKDGDIETQKRQLENIQKRIAEEREHWTKQLSNQQATNKRQAIQEYLDRIAREYEEIKRFLASGRRSNEEVVMKYEQLLRIATQNHLGGDTFETHIGSVNGPVHTGKGDIRVER